MDDLELDNPLWDFAVAVYAMPGVAEECLALQGSHGIDVNLLMFCAWLGAARAAVLSRNQLTEAQVAVRSWHDNVVRQLRAARVYSKGLPAAEDTGLRARIKRIELEAERIELAMLRACAAAYPYSADAEPAAALDANLQTFLDANGIGSEGLPLLVRLRAAALHIGATNSGSPS